MRRRHILVTVVCLLACASVLVMAACGSSAGSSMKWYQVAELYAHQDKLDETLEGQGFAYKESMNNGAANISWNCDDEQKISDLTVPGGIDFRVRDGNGAELSKQDLADGKTGSLQALFMVSPSVGTDMDDMKALADKVCDGAGLSNAKEEKDSEDSYSGSYTKVYKRKGRVSVDGQDVYWMLSLRSSDDLTLVGLYAAGSDFAL